MTSKPKVHVLGAHTDPSRFANKAMRLLESLNYEPVPINPRFKEVLEKKCYPSLESWKAESNEPVDTLTMYINPTHSHKIQDEILKIHPRRVIFNPGTENPTLALALHKTGVEVIEDCTLVMLNAGRF